MLTTPDGTSNPDGTARGISRRELDRRAFLAAGEALPFCTEATLAQDVKAIANIPPDALSASTPTRTRSAPAPRPWKPPGRLPPGGTGTRFG